MFKKILNALIEHPILTTIFVMDTAILALHKPPFIFSLVMLTTLMAVCMFFGQKLALFKQ